ncbi:MAG: class II aldolase/adducin family protein [Planctomycetaceae bacterium]|nr:class II aldolase/adducin family protein [Planctomycetaceae bacterium]
MASSQIKTEPKLRRELTAIYRLSAYFGWMDSIFNHISVRIPCEAGEEQSYLVNPEGYLSGEMSPDLLLKVNTSGKVLDQPGVTFIPAGFTIHSAIHVSREDATCIVHNHAMAGMVVSAMKEGLLPLTQISMEFYNRIAYHDFGGIELELSNQDRITQDLGNHKAMIMRNHGLLTVGETVAEAFYYMYYLHESCEIQMRTLSATKNPLIPSPEICEHTASQYDQYHQGDVQDLWAAMLRMLDREFPNWDQPKTSC